MDEEMEKIEKIILESQEFLFKLLEPVVQEITEEYKQCLEYIDSITLPEKVEISTPSLGRPKRNAAKNASTKIQSQTQLKGTKLRRPDDMTGNIYDCLAQSKISVLQDTTNITQDIAVDVTNNYESKSLFSTLSIDSDVFAAGIRKCHIKLEKLSEIPYEIEGNTSRSSTSSSKENIFEVEENSDIIAEPTASKGGRKGRQRTKKAEVAVKLEENERILNNNLEIIADSEEKIIFEDSKGAKKRTKSKTEKNSEVCKPEVGNVIYAAAANATFVTDSVHNEHNKDDETEFKHPKNILSDKMESEVISVEKNNEDELQVDGKAKNSTLDVNSTQATKINFEINNATFVQDHSIDDLNNAKPKVVLNKTNNILNVEQESNNPKDSEKNDSGFSVYEDAIAQMVTVVKDSTEKLKTPTEIKNNESECVNKDQQEHVSSDQTSSAALVDTKNTTEQIVTSSEEISGTNDATFVMSSLTNVPITIKKEYITPERPKGKMDTTVVIENLVTPVQNLRTDHDDSSLITDDDVCEEEITPERPAKIDDQPSSQVKSRIHAFEKVIASEKKTSSRVTRTKTRLDKEKLEKKMSAEVPENTKVIKVSSSNRLQVPSKGGSALKAPTSAIKKNITKFNATPLIGSKFVNKSHEKPGLAGSKDDVSKKTSKEDEALKKKELLLLEKREEQRRKRLDKERMAQLSREQQEREKLEKIEKEKERKFKLYQEQKEKAKQQRALEIEKRKKAEEMVRLKQLQLAEQKKLELKQKIEQNNFKDDQKNRINNKSDGTASNDDESQEVAMSNGFENLQSDYSTDDEEKPAKNNKERPIWCRNDLRHAAMVGQARVSTMLVDLLFNVKSSTPDLRAIFPGIEEEKLKRRSSAVWKTPPRYSMLNYHNF